MTACTVINDVIVIKKGVHCSNTPLKKKIYDSNQDVSHSFLCQNAQYIPILRLVCSPSNEICTNNSSQVPSNIFLFCSCDTGSP